MKRLLICATVFALALLAPTVSGQNAKLDELKKGLQGLNDFVGTWNGDGKTTSLKLKKESWQENFEWGWRFKADDIWMTWKFKDSKQFKSADLRFVPAKKNYELTLVDAKGQKLVFTGTAEKEVVTFERTDPTTKDAQRIKINVAGDGVRLNMVAARQAGGKGIFSPEYQVGYTMEGASLGAREKKQECVVSGGLGTSTVTFKGKTYFVCCSGCRDAFNENPEFYIKMFEAKKK